MLGLPARARRTAGRRREGGTLHGLWEILNEAGINPAPQRSASTWAAFLRSQANAPLACDVTETVTLTGARTYVLAVTEHATRRMRILGATAHRPPRG